MASRSVHCAGRALGLLLDHGPEIDDHVAIGHLPKMIVCQVRAPFFSLPGAATASRLVIFRCRPCVVTIPARLSGLGWEGSVRVDQAPSELALFQTVHSEGPPHRGPPHITGACIIVN